MGFKRVCDSCNSVFKEGEAVIINFMFDGMTVEACRDCHDLQIETFNKAPSNIEDRPPPLGYYFYVEDELMFPPNLLGAEGKLKIDFMYTNTNQLNSRIN